MNKISIEDKFLLFGYGAIATAYTILFLIKYKHVKNK